MFGTSLRVTGLAWRLLQADLCWQVGLSVVLALQPAARSAMLAVLINDVVRTWNVAGATRVSPGRCALLAGLCALGLFTTWCDVLLRHREARSYARLSQYVELDVIRQHAALDIKRHEERNVAALAARVIESGSWRLPSFFQRQFQALRLLISIVVAVTILGLARWPLLILLVAATMPELLFERSHGQVIYGIHGAEADLKRRYFDLRGHFFHLGNLGELKLYQNCQYFLTKIGELYDHFQAILRDAELRKLAGRLISTAISQAGVTVATLDVALQAIRGEIQVGTLSLLLMAIASLRQSMSGLSTVVGDQVEDGLFIDDFFAFRDLRPAVELRSPALQILPGATPDIIIENVTFSYPGAQEPALRGVSTSIPAGHRVAIVGENGSGKSTLMKLLCRFYDPDQGRILIGGQDLRTLELDSWYRIVGALLQEYARYHLPVREAIALGRTTEPIDMERVRRAAKSSELESVITTWDRAYDQQLGKLFADGMEPSVGQWQRLALARAFYRDARVLLLDEPMTSADPRAEFGVFQHLDASLRDRTILLTSHDFSAVRRADKIIVFDRGRLVEEGPHSALMTKKGIYARMFALQAQGFR